VRALRAELLEEHLGIDTARMDDVAALDVFAQVARENAERRAARAGAGGTGVGARSGDVRGIGLWPKVPADACGLRSTCGASRKLPYVDVTHSDCRSVTRQPVQIVRAVNTVRRRYPRDSHADS
jgi:hypothetical protein